MVPKVRILGLSATKIINGNCDAMVKAGLDAAMDCGKKIGGGVETEFVTLADKDIQMCKHCQWCIENRQPCNQINDDAMAVWERVLASDGILIGTPTWALTAAPLYGILTSRARYFAFFSTKLRNKVAGLMSVGYLGYGLENAVDQLYCMTGAGQIMIPVARAWAYSSTVAFGKKPGYMEHGVLDDKAGMAKVRNAAYRVVEISRMIKFATDTGIVVPPEYTGTFTGGHLTRKRVFKNGVWEVDE